MGKKREREGGGRREREEKQKCRCTMEVAPCVGTPRDLCPHRGMRLTSRRSRRQRTTARQSTCSSSFSLSTPKLLFITRWCERTGKINARDVIARAQTDPKKGQLSSEEETALDFEPTAEFPSTSSSNNTSANTSSADCSETKVQQQKVEEEEVREERKLSSQLAEGTLSSHFMQRTFKGLEIKWGETPDRYKIVFAMALAFVVCNMDKVNISIAIIPMASDYGWKPTTAGFIQSAFFYGYLLAQLPGGWLSNKFGGQRVLPFGVALWSIATLAVPLIAGDIRALSISRAAVGLGEGLSPPAAVDVISRYVPVNERSRATSIVFGGLNMGTIAGLTIAPTLIEAVGWPSVFVLFGVVGFVWCVWFDNVNPSDIVQISDGEGTSQSSGERQSESGDEVVANDEDDDKIPWVKFVQHGPLRALTYTHFCNNWAVYTVLSWLPTFYKDSLEVDLQGAAHLALLPPLAGLVVSAVAAPLADGLIERGVSITFVRKLMQSIAFLSPAACMLGCILSEDKQLSTWLLPLGLGLQTFSFAGLYSNHQDISPKYAGILLSITNIFGSMPGVIGVPFTGWLLDQTDSWTISLFVPCLFFYVSGTFIYARFGSGERLVLEEELVEKLE